MLKKIKSPLKDDYSGVYVQGNGKIFEVKQKSNIGAFDDCTLIPLNFEDGVKQCHVHMMEIWLRRGIVRPYNPLSPSAGAFRVKQLDFKPMSSKIRELLEGGHHQTDEF